MKKLLTIILFLSFACQANGQASRIIAIVNDRPITYYDLQSRRQMVIALNNIDTRDSKIMAQIDASIVNILIDDELLFQYAEKINTKIDESDIDEAINNIAQKNKTSTQSLYSFLESKHVNRKIFRNQIKAELVKMQILSSITRTINITPNEIDAAILGTNSKDAQIKAYIFTSNDKSDKALKHMYKLQKNLSNCAKLKDSLYAKFATKTTVESNLKSLDMQLQSIIKDLRVDQVSSVSDVGAAFQLTLVCKKDIENVSSEENEYIANFLTNKKMSHKAQKFFEDLRKKAYIKVMLTKD